MVRTILSKLGQLIPVIVLVSFASFFLLELVPGDPAVQALGPEATPAEYAAAREDLGLNEPLGERYVNWVGDIATGDLGQSIFPPHRDVSELVAQRLPVTLELALLSMLLAVAISVPVALWTAYRQGGPADRAATAVAFSAISIPTFMAGLLFVFFFVFNVTIVKTVGGIVGGLVTAGLAWVALRRVRTIPASPMRNRSILVGGGVTLAAALATVAFVTMLPEFPRQGFVRVSEGGLSENLTSIALPVFTLALAETAVFVRLLRSDLIHTLGEDFILSARAKGMPAWRIMFRDALRPSLFSLITVMSVTLGRVIGGSAIVETIFNLPGMGRLIIESITAKDYPIVQVCVLIVAVVYVLINALVDVLYGVLDPRIRRHDA